MTKFTKIERERLKALVQDCITYRLTEKESLVYIAARFGKPISQAHYYVLKKRLESDSNAQDWINRFARTGFISEHMKRYNEMDLLLQVAFRMLIEEDSKKSDERDPNVIFGLMSQITQISKRLTNLQSGTPILSQLSAMLQGRNQHHQQQQIQQQLLPTPSSSRITTTTTATNGSGSSNVEEQQELQDLQDVERLTSHIPNMERRMEVQRAFLEDRRQERERQQLWDNDDDDNDGA